MDLGLQDMLACFKCGDTWSEHNLQTMAWHLSSQLFQPKTNDFLKSTAGLRWALSTAAWGSTTFSVNSCDQTPTQASRRWIQRFEQECKLWLWLFLGWAVEQHNRNFWNVALILEVFVQKLNASDLTLTSWCPTPKGGPPRKRLD